MKDTGRLEGFSDGLFAITITIMIVEFETPDQTTLAALLPLWPVFLSYILSFTFIGIYWNNHHHMLHVTEQFSGGILWANLHLLFWLTLIPFATAWMGENSFAPIPTAIYGGVLLMSTFAWYILERLIVAEHGSDSLIAEAVEGSIKEKVSVLMYFSAIIFAFVSTLISGLLYAAIALMWIVPDRRFKRVSRKKQRRDEEDT